MGDRKQKQTALNLAFTFAALYDYRENINLLLQAGADIHYANDAALMYAAQQGHSKMVDYLLLMGANPHGREALNRAQQHGHHETVRVLNDWAAGQRAMQAKYPNFKPRCDVG